MLSRVIGTEMEYLVEVRVPAGDRQVTGEEARRVLGNIPAEIKRAASSGGSFYLGNGARFYVDINNYLEYATPEDNSLTGNVANEIAGEQILTAALDECVEEGSLENYTVRQRVLQSETAPFISWGAHESYGCRGLNINRESLALLGVFLAVRGLFTGAGTVYSRSHKDQKHFALSQKALDIYSDFDGSTTRNKPVVNLRQESLGSSDLPRAHITCGDMPIGPWAKRMRLGMTSLVFGLLEAGQTIDFLAANKGTLAGLMRQTATDLDFKEPFMLANNKTILPIDIHEVFLDKLSKLSDLPLEEKQVLGEWERAYSDFKEDPTQLYDRVDWVMRKRYIDRIAAKSGAEWSEVAVAANDKFDLLDKRGVGVSLRKTIWKEWMPDESLIIERITAAPQTTRAKVRGDFIKEYGEKGGVAEWQSVTFPGGAKHPLLDPYDTTPIKEVAA